MQQIDRALDESNFDLDENFRSLPAAEVARRLLRRDGVDVLADHGHHVVLREDGSGGCYSDDQLIELALGTMCVGHGQALLDRRDREKRWRNPLASINLAIRPRKRRH